MNEGKKTGAFWGAASLMLAVGLFVAWPASNTEESSVSPGKPLFEQFKDPSTASNLKIVTFDELQGQLATFEVRRDSESGQWTIPSRKGYPADAVEQMKDAANSLVGLSILDVQTESPEDHEALGVVEPKLEALEVGDTGVGRLVTFKDDSQKTLASLIIGNPVKNEDGKIYVRKPGQDPVYVVKMDDATLSTKFQDWIEDDLLQMSSINIEQAVIKDYSASISGRSVALSRNYTAEIGLEGSDWKLNELLEYSPENAMAEPKRVEMPADKELNTAKLNEMKNALDDLKIVDVVRKPDGMSANLRADKELISDNEAVQSLYTRGFFPVGSGTEGDFEVLSANGELNVTVDQGVEYVLRFGDVQGLSDATSEEGDEDAGGVNRFLLVTARVNEEQFPAPNLKPVPQTIDELAAMLGVDASTPGEEEPAETEPAETKPVEETAAPAEEMKPAEEATATEEPKADEAAKEEETAAETTAEKPAEDKSAEDKPSQKKPADEAPADAKQADVTGSGEATGDGQGAEPQEADDQTTEEAGTDEKSIDDKVVAAKEETDTTDEPTASEPAATPPAAESVEMDLQPASGDAVVDMPEAVVEDDGELTFAELTEEEKQERLEAEQEKVLKENTRMLDARKDRLNAAKRRVADLNARFADWYYIIPEATYRQLRINRDDLFVTAGGEAPMPPGNPVQMPNIPGMSPGFGN